MRQVYYLQVFPLNRHDGNRVWEIFIKLISALIILAISPWPWDSSFADDLYDKALQHYKAGNWAEVVHLLQEKTQLDAGEHNLLGWTFLRLSNPDDAKKQFELSLSLDPQAYDSYCGLGYADLQLRLFEEAQDNFTKGISRNSKNIDCLLGMGLTLEKLREREKALGVFEKVLSIDKDNSTAKEKIMTLSPQSVDKGENEDIKFFAQGDYFWVVRGKKKAEPIFIKGVNMGFALPGRFPTEFPEEEKTYLEWFKLISEMNANLIRIYTILPPHFYHALRKYNQGRQENEKLFLIQGIWAELPTESNFKNPAYVNDIKREIQNAVDVIHGNANILHRYGHAHGIYGSDISGCVLGFIFGREWEPPAIIAYNRLSLEKNYAGKYLQISDGNPMEVWVTEMLDYLIDYESERYKTQKPVAIMNWPPLDPVYHKTEATFREEVEIRRKMGEKIDMAGYDQSKTFDEDAVSIDERKVVVNQAYQAGLFVSYHVYPYYPDFLRYEEKYGKLSCSEGSSYYCNYLKDLKNHYRNMPLLISEFGVPTSRGIARFHPEGLNQGGLNENEQADILKRLILSIQKSGCAGGVVFSWIDEWVKTSWMVRGREERDQFWFNAQDPEENYGLMAVSPDTMGKLTGNPSAWNKATLLYEKDSTLSRKVLDDGFDGARNLKRIYADYDAGYLYLRIDVSGSIDWGKVAYLIGIDTYGQQEGNHKLPFNLGLESPIGLEYVVLIHGERSKILIDERYNHVIFDPSLLVLPGLSGYRENKGFKPVPSNDGSFTELITIHRRRFSREGEVFPEKIYNASPLREGRLIDDSLSDFYYSKEGNYIEISIPWGLLNFSDPSQRQIVYSNEERKTIEGVKFLALSYKPRSREDSTAADLKDRMNITDMIPGNLSDIHFYSWDRWEMPQYTVHPKKSYYAMREIYKSIKNPDLTLHLPDGFDYLSVIKNHYKSVDEFIHRFDIGDAHPEDLWGLALAHLVRGLVANEPFPIQKAQSLFTLCSRTSTNPREKELSKRGAQYLDKLLGGNYQRTSDTQDILKRILIEKRKPPVQPVQKIVIGNSAIKLSNRTRIKTQVDRVTRDWLLAYNFKSSPWTFLNEGVVPWHEGERIKEIVAFTGAQVYPVWGTRVKKIGNTWYAPDAEGVFRFMLSEDKVYNYPSNLIIDDQTVIINDTHGINAIAWDSSDADLVIGCGDHEGKVEAAYYLAQKGVHVYLPTDRYLSKLIGTCTNGVIIGSAPIKKTRDGAVIGNQPITIEITEPIVVSNAEGGYPLQYYDTPCRYFKEVERYIGKPLNIISVNVTEYGKGEVVVDKARKVGAKIIGIRVWGKAEHDAVSNWLKEDKDRRAVLFHSAVYPEGYRLFFEFSQQTSFGDIRIDFQ